ncbi:hypothetical protein CDL12_15749 [Handroanthus impetiginosus]|uniref:CASP-like protein n=1 Tax=Handroanthus impetiginosus TaxID=429701 RepID=A0A2G9H2X1_9LAMI|nr:hypothetical protein CDL12_15749 [Handroanthus impetiginosus]
MASTVDKPHQSPPLKTHKPFFLIQTSLRILASCATLAASWIMLTNKQTTLVFGIHADARYSYSTAIKFFTYSNLIACAFTVLSLFLAFILKNKAVDHSCLFFLFLHDLIITVLIMAGSAAATAIGYVGKYGDSHAGWTAICDYFSKFCNRTIAALMLSYLGFSIYLILTVISANRSSQIRV